MRVDSDLKVSYIPETIEALSVFGQFDCRSEIWLFLKSRDNTIQQGEMYLTCCKMFEKQFVARIFFLVSVFILF